MNGICPDCERDPCVCDWYAYEEVRDEREQAETPKANMTAAEYERYLAAK